MVITRSAALAFFGSLARMYALLIQLFIMFLLQELINRECHLVKPVSIDTIVPQPCYYPVTAALPGHSALDMTEAAPGKDSPNKSQNIAERHPKPQWESPIGRHDGLTVVALRAMRRPDGFRRPVFQNLPGMSSEPFPGAVDRPSAYPGWDRPPDHRATVF